MFFTDTALHKFAIWFIIRLGMIISVFLFQYCFFVEKSNAFIYLHKSDPK